MYRVIVEARKSDQGEWFRPYDDQIFTLVTAWQILDHIRDMEKLPDHEFRFLLSKDNGPFIPEGETA